MAFDFTYLARNEYALQYDKTYNPSSGATGAPIPVIWCFNAAAGGANNSTAQTQAANYFNAANGYFTIGDLIWVISNDPGFHLLYVSANAAGVVTVVQLV